MLDLIASQLLLYSTYVDKYLLYLYAVKHIFTLVGAERGAMLFGHVTTLIF